MIPQKNCTTCSPEQRKFDPSRSSTFSWSPLGGVEPGFSTGGDTIPLGEPQGADCTWAVDNVSIQGLKAPSFSFLVCYDEGPAMTTQPGIDGILGLGLNTSQEGQLQYALLDAGLLDSGIFGLYTPSGQISGGQLTLGGVDESKFEGDLVWVSLDRELIVAHQQWVVGMQTILVNGQQLMVPESSSNASTSTPKVPYPKSIVQVLDSGTSFIMAPDNATAAALYAQVSPKIYQLDPVGTWGCACADMDAIAASGAAELTFLLGYDGAVKASVPSGVFNLGPYPGMDGICQAVVNNWQEGVLYNGTVGLWELGSPLLKNYYTAWDGAGMQVGFAPLKPAPVAASPSPGRTCR